MLHFLLTLWFLSIEFTRSRRSAFALSISPQRKVPTRLFLAVHTSLIPSPASIDAVATRLRTAQQSLPPALDDLVRLTPPSSYYKLDQLHNAHNAMLRLLEDEHQCQDKSFMDDATAYFFQIMHVACHEILGYVHISLAQDVYDRLSYKHPDWCRWMYEMFNTNGSVDDQDLIRVLQDWVSCTPNPNDVREYLLSSTRPDLWDHISNLNAIATVPGVETRIVSSMKREGVNLQVMSESLTSLLQESCGVTDIGQNLKQGMSQAEALNADDVLDLPPRTIVDVGVTSSSDETFAYVSTCEIVKDRPLIPKKGVISEHLTARDIFYTCVQKLDMMMRQPRLNSTDYYSAAYTAIDALKKIDMVSEDDLRAGLFIASSCLLRRDSTWIFRLLDQRGVVQRDDLYQLLHVYCNDHRQPFGIHFALSLLKYCEDQSEKNAYIRRPDPLMYRVVLKAIANSGSYGFGNRALQVMKCMSTREKTADIDSEGWKPVFEDIASAVSAFVEESQSWQSVQRADRLVRSLYNSPVGKREPPPTSPKLNDLVDIGQKLRIIPIGRDGSPGPLFKVLNAYKDQDSHTAQDRLVAALSIFEFALEQTAAGNGTLEELSKQHFFLVVDLCRRTNTFLIQETVRLYRRADQLVQEGLVSREMVSPSVSYQILSLLATDRSPGHSVSAEYILDNYLSETKEPRLAAFQYAIQCCCSESSAWGSRKAVALLESALCTFPRKPFRDSIFLEVLQQLELHDAEGSLSVRVYNMLCRKLSPTPFDVDTRIALFKSTYRCLLKDPYAHERVQEIKAKLTNLKQLYPKHTLVSDECSQGIKSPAASGCPSSAIDILLSSKKASDIDMAASILEQSEADGTPHENQAYQHVIEAYIGINDMRSATEVLKSLKANHPTACTKLESVLFDILLSSDQASELVLAECMVRWTNDVTDLRYKAAKLVITCMNLDTVESRDIAARVLKYLGNVVAQDDEVWTNLCRLVAQDPSAEGY